MILTILPAAGPVFALSPNSQSLLVPFCPAPGAASGSSAATRTAPSTTCSETHFSFDVSVSDNRPHQYTLTSSSGNVILSGTIGTAIPGAPAVVTGRINPAGLSPGNYAAAVQVSADQGPAEKLDYTVTDTPYVTVDKPSITLSPNQSADDHVDSRRSQGQLLPFTISVTSSATGGCPAKRRAGRTHVRRHRRRGADDIPFFSILRSLQEDYPAPGP